MFFNLCWIWSKKKKTSGSSFYKENNFKPCLTKQLLNMFKLWCERVLSKPRRECQRELHQIKRLNLCRRFLCYPLQNNSCVFWRTWMTATNFWYSCLVCPPREERGGARAPFPNSAWTSSCDRLSDYFLKIPKLQNFPSQITTFGTSSKRLPS